MSGGDLDLQTARALHQQGHLPEALAMFDAVLAHRPEEVEALLRRGSILSRMNKSEAALASVIASPARRRRSAAAQSRRRLR